VVDGELGRERRAVASNRRAFVSLAVESLNISILNFQLPVAVAALYADTARRRRIRPPLGPPLNIRDYRAKMRSLGG